jgi:cyclase
VIPVLLLQGEGLVKTVGFEKPKYVGDPRNAVKIFNEKMADELGLLDIDATRKNRPPRFSLVSEIVSEAFMPIAYGGGIRTVEDARDMIARGVEKIIVGSHAVKDPAFIAELASSLGSQSLVVCMDVKDTGTEGYQLYTDSGGRRTSWNPIDFAREAQALGAGEIMVNSIDRDGTMEGYDLELIHAVSEAISVPLIACGGAGSLADLGAVVREAGASAAAAGSLFVFHGRYRSILITYPEPHQLDEVLPA